jgi:hypothetical protein
MLKNEGASADDGPEVAGIDEDEDGSEDEQEAHVPEPPHQRQSENRRQIPNNPSVEQPINPRSHGPEKKARVPLGWECVRTCPQ